MTLRRLKTFVEVAKSGKMSEAARNLNITQASVSQSIAEIEREYGIRLFERMNKRLYLTPEGRQMFSYASQLLSCEKAMEDYLQLSSKGKRLYIGASLTIGASILSDLVAQMQRENPNVKNYVTVARNAVIVEQLLNNDLDIGLGDVFPNNSSLVCTPIMRDTLVLVCPPGHPLWGRKSVRLADLANIDLVVRDSTSSNATRLEQQLSERQIPYNVTWVCADTMASKQAVHAGHGVTTISERLVREEIARGDLWPLEILDVNMGRTFNIMYHKDKFLTDYMHSFIHLAESFEDTI